jgi:hypothetical protein
MLSSVWNKNCRNLKNSLVYPQVKYLEVPLKPLQGEKKDSLIGWKIPRDVLTAQVSVGAGL